MESSGSKGRGLSDLVQWSLRKFLGVRSPLNPVTPGKSGQSGRPSSRLDNPVDVSEYRRSGPRTLILIHLTETSRVGPTVVTGPFVVRSGSAQGHEVVPGVNTSVFYTLVTTHGGTSWSGLGGPLPFGTGSLLCRGVPDGFLHTRDHRHVYDNWSLFTDDEERGTSGPSSEVRTRVDSPSSVSGTVTLPGYEV